MASNLKEHFDKFMSDNPSAGYEEWISALHPNEASDGLLDLGSTIIDAKYYHEGNECLEFWNSHAKAPVAVTPKNMTGESSLKLDLLSGEFGMEGEEDDSQSSPLAPPRRTVQPGEDLHKFD